VVELVEVIEAVYEKGVLRPLKPLKLKEGEKVIVKIEREKLSEVIKRYQAVFKLSKEDVRKFLEERR